MILERREFLRMLGLGAGSASLGGCWPWMLPDERVELARRGPGIITYTNSICGLCEGGCGITVRLSDGLPVGLAGNPRHPLNRGGLCPVGQAGLEILYSPDRLQNPLRRGANAALEPTTWEVALGEIGQRLRALQEAGRGSRVAVVSGEHGELFSDLATRFAHALGSPHAVCLGRESALPFRLSQGLDAMPGFDLTAADLIFAFGLDIFEDGPAPVHAMAAMIGSRSTEERCDLVHIGTRLSPTGGRADEHVPVLPGTHAALALGIAHVLVREGSYDRRFIDEHTFGFDDWIDETGRARLGFRRLLLERYYPDRAASLCGLEADRIIRLARRLAEAEAPLVVAGGEATASSNGTWTALAIHSLNALLGSFDRPGGVRLPATLPLPPLPALAVDAASGERAAGDHLEVDPLGALAEGVLDGSRPIDLLVVCGAEPLLSSPVGEHFRAALERIETVVTLTPVHNDTAAVADFVLPTSVYLETWHESTTPRTVAANVLGLAQPVIAPLFGSRPAGDLLLDLARRAGGAAAAALPWESYAAYLKHRLEGLAALGQGTLFTGSFEESWVRFLEERGWRFLEHDQVEQFWQDLVRESGWWNPIGTQGDWRRLFPNTSGRFEFFSLDLERHLMALGTSRGATERAAALVAGSRALGLVAGDDEACLPHFEPPVGAGTGDLTLIPFRPITARGFLATSSPMVLEMFGHIRLSGWETWAEVGPETAQGLDLRDGDRVAVESERGRVEATLAINRGTGPGVVHVPLGLGRSDQQGLAGGRGANPLALLLPVRDSLSGRWSSTATRVRLRLIERRRYGGPAPEEGGHS